MTTKPCSSGELRTLFLFENLTDAQLEWLCQRGRTEVIPAGPVYAEDDPAALFYVLLEGTVVITPGGRRRRWAGHQRGGYLNA